MLTTVRSIGNSRGVLIPAAFLASCQIEDQVDMQLHDGSIVLKPIQRTPRAGWFDGVSSATETRSTQESLEADTWADAPLSDDSEWTW